MIEEKLGEGRANRVLEAMLPPDFTAQEVYDNHQVMMKHGQNICFYQRPACEQCVLLDLCPTGQANMEKRTKPVKEKWKEE
jgi:endonuclease-3